MPELGSTLARPKAKTGARGSSSRSGAARASEATAVEHRWRIFAGEADGGDGNEPVRSVLGERGEGGAEKWSRWGGAKRLAAFKAGTDLLGPAGCHPAGVAGERAPRVGQRMSAVGTVASVHGRERHGAGVGLGRGSHAGQKEERGRERGAREKGRAG
jgi:hypothetical protein